MEIIREQALILRSFPYGDTSAILHLLTPEGKISAMAKGAYRPKSKFFGRLEPLYLVEVILSRKESRELDILTDVEILNSFKKVLDDFDKMVYATAILEVCSQLFQTGQALDDEFQEILDLLNELQQEQASAQMIFLRFLDSILRYSGFELSLSHCSDCGKAEAEIGEDVFVNLDNGNFCCGACTKKNNRRVNMGNERFHILRALGEKKISTENIHREATQKLLNFYLAYIRLHWKSDLKVTSLDLLNNQIEEM